MMWLSDAAVDRLCDAADWPSPIGGRYEILQPLARGGMGTVYLARDHELDRVVAIKVLSAVADETAGQRTRQEAHVLASLEHPGIVPVYDVGVLDDDRVFYVMKRVEGARLDQHVAERPLFDRLQLFTRICEPVAFAHAHGVIHRDLKPDNVMVGSFGEVLVMDWGVAQQNVELRTENSELRTENSELRTQNSQLRTLNPEPRVVGTRAYMPPEQERGQAVDARADVYALGGILHFLLTGAPPDAGDLAGPKAVQAICRKARADEPDDRYQDVLSLSADVERYLAGKPVTASPETAVERVARFVRTHRVAIVIVVAYLTLRVIIALLAPLR